MNELKIVEIKKTLRTDSRLLASFLDHRHRTILENIDKYLNELSEIDPIPFEKDKGKALPQGGFSKSTRYALLTEDQCYFLLTLMRNNPKVVAAKLSLVKAFRDARQQLINRDVARIEGKKVRLSETDSIKKLVDYASAQGSENANKYYANITKMTNKIVGVETGGRDNLDEDTLKKISIAETVVDIAIRDGIKEGMAYKDIYQLAKYRASLVMPSVSDVKMIK